MPIMTLSASTKLLLNPKFCSQYTLKMPIMTYFGIEK